MLPVPPYIEKDRGKKMVKKIIPPQFSME